MLVLLIRYTMGKSGDGYISVNPVYAIVLFWPEDNIVQLNSPIAGPVTHLSFLGYNGTVEVQKKIRSMTLA